MPWVLRAAVAAGGWGCRCGRLGGWAGRVEEQVRPGAETPEAVQSALQSVRERFSEHRGRSVGAGGVLLGWSSEVLPSSKARVVVVRDAVTSDSGWKFSDAAGTRECR